MDLKSVDLIVDKHQEKRTALISILHDVQDRYKYLPEEALKMVASRLRMDINEIYGVATFYKSFSLDSPRESIPSLSVWEPLVMCEAVLRF